MAAHELEWRVPWEAGWSLEKKVAAAEKLVSYIKRGTWFDVASRAQVTEAQVVQHTPTSEPYITMKLER